MSKDNERALTDEEKYQETLGKLLWLSSKIRPDLCFDTMELSTNTKSAKVKHLNILSKVVKKMNYGPKAMKNNYMDIEQGSLK